jgi:hypothetical protein
MGSAVKRRQRQNPEKGSELLAYDWSDGNKT